MTATESRAMNARADPVVTVAQMRAAEQAAVAAGTSEWELMRRAGEGAAQWIARAAAGRSVTVLCGPGNNGGDGYVIAECLRQGGASVRVVAPVVPKTDSANRALAAFQGDILRSASGLHAPVLVDCLFGSGLTRSIDGEFAKALQQCAASHSYRIAIDLPSGVEGDTGALLGNVPQFDLTLALGAWKQAHFLMPSEPRMGMLRLVPIGLEFSADAAMLAPRPHLTAPAPDAHKYTRGLVAIVGGPMVGAALLAARAAMHAGAGNVRLMSDHLHPALPPELVVKEGTLREDLGDERIGAILVGPGLGRGTEARARVAAALKAARPCVLDADALHVLDAELLKGAGALRILVTPHEGELAKLCETFGVTAQDKLGRARALHELTGMTVLAKGPDNVLVGKGGTVRFFRRGTSWLSAAGSGDVLAGITAARLAGGASCLKAAEQAVWLHHEAGRIAAPTFTAGELAEAVKPAIAQLL